MSEVNFTEQDLYDLGNEITGAILKHLPTGITWVSNYVGDERKAKIAAGRQAFQELAEKFASHHQKVLEEALGPVSVEERDLAMGIDRSWHTDEILRLFLAGRRQKYLPVKVDPAVEAVHVYLRNRSSSPELQQAIEIVAAVRAADKEKP